MTTKLTHLNKSGEPSMVDISSKPDSHRIAIAKGEIVMQSETLESIRVGDIKKGNVLAVAQIAGIMAAKRTANLIPLCHPISIEVINVDIELDERLPGAYITASVQSTGKTGVEMEALTAVSIAALTIYDMVKALEKTMKIQNIRLIEKHGGISGDVVNR
jgi:cyclic pyranopterin phosphate synthase